MLKYINLILFLCLLFILSLILFLLEKKDNLGTAMWICDQQKAGFISPSFQKYEYISEDMRIQFYDNNDIVIHEYIETKEKDKRPQMMEITYNGDYIQTTEYLTINFNHMRLSKSHQDENVNQAYKEYEGYSILYRYKKIGNKLYFYTDNRKESFDMVCYNKNAT